MTEAKPLLRDAVDIAEQRVADLLHELGWLVENANCGPRTHKFLDRANALLNRSLTLTMHTELIFGAKRFQPGTYMVVPLDEAP